MSCPVCEKELDFHLPEDGGFYYDCPVCHSSLVFQDGKWELISSGKAPATRQSLTQVQTDSASVGKEPSHVSLPDSQAFIEEPEDEQEDKPEAGDQAGHAPAVSGRSRLNVEPAEGSRSSLDQTSLEPKEAIPATLDSTSSKDELALQSDEVTEVPEMGEDPADEFMESPEDQSPGEEASFVFQEQESEEGHLKEDFSEVIEFSKDKQRQEKGLYLYRLFLKEINSKALKDKIISLLEDVSLEINLEDLSSYREKIIEEGKIVLPRLSPIQVYVILHHLMGLPLKIHWEQSHIADS